MNANEKPSRTNWAVVLALCGVALIVALRLLRTTHSAPPVAVESAAVTTPDEAVPASAPAASATDALEAKWGIQATGLRLTAGGNVLDFRYRVLDATKAARLLKQQDETTYLVDPANGRRLSLANANRSGSLHRAAKELIGGHSYFMYFPNPGKQFQVGSKVTLVMGNFRAESLAVE